jgi:hypothetical protein
MAKGQGGKEVGGSFIDAEITFTSEKEKAKKDAEQRAKVRRFLTLCFTMPYLLLCCLWLGLTLT